MENEKIRRGRERRTKRTAIIVIVVVLTTLSIAVALGIMLSQPPAIILEVWPRSNDTTSPLILNSTGGDSSWLARSEFFNDYGSPKTDAALNRVPCFYGQHELGENQVCDVPVDVFGPCNPSNQYSKETPCVFLKLNKILNWSPVPYNSTEGLPDKMPEDLKQDIKVKSGKPEANTVWVSCTGETSDDNKNIGPLLYFPQRGFPAYYYPFTNKEGYLSPLVAVMFENPKTDVIISIECKAWAKNIQSDREEQLGSVHFKLMVGK